MIDQLPIEDALDQALRRLQAGEPINAVLADFPEAIPELEQLLHTSSVLTASVKGVEPSPALLPNILVAVRQPDAGKQSHQGADGPAAWWRVFFTNWKLTVPAGSAIMALLLVALLGRISVHQANPVPQILPTPTRPQDDPFDEAAIAAEAQETSLDPNADGFLNYEGTLDEIDASLNIF